MEKDKLSPHAASSLAALLKACGHPVRLRLLCAIESQGLPDGRPWPRQPSALHGKGPLPPSLAPRPSALHGKAPCVGDLSRCLGISQPVISQHLAVLKRAGIVSARVSGNRRLYSIREPFVKALVRSCLTASARRS